MYKSKEVDGLKTLVRMYVLGFGISTAYILL